MKKVPHNRWFRRPKTKNERTQNQNGVSRAKRNSKNVPSNWDDLTVACRYDRSWKNKRKLRYRIVNK